QGALAGAVRADEGDALGAAELEVEVSVDGLGAVAEADALEAQDDVARADAGGKVEVEAAALALGGESGALGGQLFDLLLAALGLAGARGRGAEALHELAGVGDLAVEGAHARLALGLAQRLLLFVGSVVAGIHRKASALERGDAVGVAVQEG